MGWVMDGKGIYNGVWLGRWKYCSWTDSPLHWRLGAGLTLLVSWYNHRLWTVDGGTQDRKPLPDSCTEA